MISAFYSYAVPNQQTDDPQTLYQMGLKAFQEQKLEDSKAYFSKAASLESNNKYILYNWGLTEHSLGNNGMAIAAWRRSLNIDPSFLPSKKALNYLKDLLPNDILNQSQTEWESFRSKFLNNFSANTLFSSFLLLMLTSGFLLIRFMAQRKFALINETSLPKSPIIALFLVGVLIINLSLAGAKLIDQLDQRATIIVKSVKVKVAPNKESNNIFELLEGYEVIVVKRTKDWSQVTYPGGLTGWVQNTSLFVTTTGDLL